MNPNANKTRNALHCPLRSLRPRWFIRSLAPFAVHSCLRIHRNPPTAKRLSGSKVPSIVFAAGGSGRG